MSQYLQVSGGHHVCTSAHPVLAGAHFLDHEFIKDEHSPHEQSEFREVLKQIAKTPDYKFTYNEMLAQWGSLQTALAVESHDLDEASAFSKEA